MVWLRGVLAAAVVLALGCNGESLGGSMRMPAATGGSGVAPGTGGISGSLGTGGGPAGGNVCGIVTTATAVAPVSPDILVVFDRSATMGDDSSGESCAGPCGPSSRASLLASAMENVIAANPQVNWGLSLYGGDQSCSVGSGVAVGVGPSTLMPITAALATWPPPSGDAPTAAAIYNAITYLDSLTDSSPRYIMLVTDGHSSCSGSDEDGASGASAIAAALAAGWPTFVVGLQPGSGADGAGVGNLDTWAQAGGEGKQPGSTFYAPEDLWNVLTPNVSDATACVMPLAKPPAPGVTLSVSVTMSDGSSSNVPEDPTSGWSFWDPAQTSIGFNGQWCEQMKAGQITWATVYYECPVVLVDGLGQRAAR